MNPKLEQTDLLAVVAAYELAIDNFCAGRVTTVGEVPECNGRIAKLNDMFKVYKSEQLDAAVAELAARPVQEPYAYEFGRANGDGTYSIVIERGDLEQVAPNKYDYVEPKGAVKDRPIKPLYTAPQPPASAQPSVPDGWTRQSLIDVAFGLDNGVKYACESAARLLRGMAATPPADGPAQDDDEDMAAVGRALIQAIEAHAPDGWHPADCPSEIVGDLRGMLDEAQAEIAAAQQNADKVNARQSAPIERYNLDAHIDGMDQMREFVLASDHDSRVHDLETLCDPAGMTIENALLRDQTRQLDAMIGRLKREIAAQPDPSLRYEQALSELVGKIAPGLDSGDILADAQAASAALSAQQDAELLDAATFQGSGNKAKRRIIAQMIAQQGANRVDASFDLVAHLYRQRAWSERTFGPGPRSQGVVDHIRKELLEIEADPGDVKEWIDVAILAFDGAWRSGATPEQIVEALVAKQIKNEGRTWPDWRTADPTKAIEHVRSDDQAMQQEKP